MSLPVAAIFDVGKTNKKLLLFDASYRIVYQETEHFAEVVDEDGFPCEDLVRLSNWIRDRYAFLLHQKQFAVKAVNFSAYGASFVHLDQQGDALPPLYNYLKPFPEALQSRFYATYGGEAAFSLATASPVLGHLNSGLQLYWLKYARPETFNRIACSLHLPQYLSYLLGGGRWSDMTSIGCHTGLWHFTNGDYHPWVAAEGIVPLLAPICPTNDTICGKSEDNLPPVGIGLHDSSAALIPYLMHLQEPFILLSTGTWCISLNPFNAQPLTDDELQQDCLCYLTHEGAPVKAARLFAGYEHEQQVARIASHFGVAPDFFRDIMFDAGIHARLEQDDTLLPLPAKNNGMPQQSQFGLRPLSAFQSPAEAYHCLMMDLMHQQQASTSLVLGGSDVRRIFVDGGFSKNKVYMNLLAAAFPHLEVYAATMAQASALGAALVLHRHWNSGPIPTNLIELEYYRITPATVLS